MKNILKVIEFVKENNLRLAAGEGLIITDSEGCIVFQATDNAKAFKQACEWIGEDYEYI